MSEKAREDEFVSMQSDGNGGTDVLIEGVDGNAYAIPLPAMQRIWADRGAAVAPLLTLASYADHRMTCRALVSDMAIPCDCGFSEANKALEGWKQ